MKRTIQLLKTSIITPSGFALALGFLLSFALVATPMTSRGQGSVVESSCSESDCAPNTSLVVGICCNDANSNNCKTWNKRICPTITNGFYYTLKSTTAGWTCASDKSHCIEGDGGPIVGG